MNRLFCILFLFSTFINIEAQEQTVTAKKTGNHIDVTIGDKFFTSYHFSDDEKYPYFYPVNGPISGGSVTTMRNGLYPHQSSLYLSCDKVNGSNFWQEGLERGQILSTGATIKEAKGKRIVIEDECVWKGANYDIPFIDRRKITISSPSKKVYILDFEVELEAMTDISITKTIHSLFCARIDEDFTPKQGGVMMNAEGKKNEKFTKGISSAWMDCYGKRKSGFEGIAIMQHPSNRWYPSKWVTRDYGLISPSPILWPENNKFTKFKKGEIIKQHYRVIVHGGNTKDANIAQLFKDYKKINYGN